MTMASDIPQLRGWVREFLAGRVITEKRMFGGITFMLDGNMLCCASSKGLMVRVGKEAEAKALRLPHARPCDGAGHRMPGFVMLGGEGLRSRQDITAGLELALHYVSAMPPKAVLPKATSRRPRLVTMPQGK